MNYTEIAHWIAIGKDAITGIAAAVAAYVAVMGLKTWKRQLLGNANHELSRRLLLSAYKLREAIRWMRNPFISSGEMAAALKAAGLSESPGDDSNDRGEELAYQARWQKVADAQREFAAELLEAEALWGSSIRKQVDALAACTAELYTSIRFQRQAPDAIRRIELGLKARQNISVEEDGAIQE